MGFVKSTIRKILPLRTSTFIKSQNSIKKKASEMSDKLDGLRAAVATSEARLAVDIAETDEVLLVMHDQLRHTLVRLESLGKICESLQLNISQIEESCNAIQGMLCEEESRIEKIEGEVTRLRQDACDQ